MHLWDWAALVPVIEGAGGRMTDWNGSRCRRERRAYAGGRRSGAAGPSGRRFWLPDLRGRAAWPYPMAGAKGDEKNVRRRESCILCRAGGSRPAWPPRAEPAAEAQTRTYGLVLLRPADAAGRTFRTLPYVNPDAPKGGDVALSADRHLRQLQPLHRARHAAPATSPGLGPAAAQRRRRTRTRLRPPRQGDRDPADHMGVAFELRPEARFNDGTPVTADDVAWTFNTLREKGRPYLPAVLCRRGAASTVEGRRRVVFHFKSANKPRTADDPRRDCRCCPSIGGRAAISPSR